MISSKILTRSSVSSVKSLAFGFNVNCSLSSSANRIVCSSLASVSHVSSRNTCGKSMLDAGKRFKLINSSGKNDFRSVRHGSSSALEKEMQSFLDEEIKAEKANSTQARAIPGFEVMQDGSCLRLKRAYKDEQITIRVDINASTIDDDLPQLSQESEYQPSPLVSKPDFAVEVRKPNGKVLCMTCHFIKNEDFGDGPEQVEQSQEEPQQKDDLFEIEAFTVVDDKHIDNDLELADNVYLGDASLVDGQLYDLLMDYLDERGIGKDFANSLMEYCTAYEHERYVELLEKLRTFIK
ncbi:complement C1q binding protein P32 [Brevipalpus obovatus]|uniref:complement C1q binding protein P32 n=1 Tax=Brevipalpus obovatus TaxID=246614 RepID=UPI003D9F0923